MSNRFFRFTAAVSVLCGVLVFFLFRVFPPPELRVPAGGKSFAVLVLDESRDDRYVREILNRGGIEGVISESSQEVAVDDFDALKMVPLDSFQNEIEGFDPRDDGYAAKLKAFFVRDGKRYFFIPLEDTFFSGTAKLKKQVASLLGDIPFTLTILEQKRPIFRYLALLAAALAFSLYLSRSPRFFVFEFPVLLAFSPGGSFGFVLAAILCGIWELLREPLGELLAARRYDRGAIIYAGPGFAGLRERLRPFRMNCFLSLLFFVFFIAVSVAGSFSPFPLIGACLSFFLLYFLAFRVEAERIQKSRHIPFVPVPLLPFRARTFFLFPLLLPFVAASALVLFLPRAFPEISLLRGKDPLVEPQYLVSSGDYYRHIAFQQSFSYRTLDQDLKELRGPGSGALNQEGYLQYYLGDDGLIGGSMAYAGGGVPRVVVPQGVVPGNAVPPFPLEKLMEFLLNYGRVGAAGDSKKTSDTVSHIFAVSGISYVPKEWISVAIVFAVSVLNFLRPGVRSRKKKKVPVFRDKRIAA